MLLWKPQEIFSYNKRKYLWLNKDFTKKYRASTFYRKITHITAESYDSDSSSCISEDVSGTVDAQSGDSSKVFNSFEDKTNQTRNYTSFHHYLSFCVVVSWSLDYLQHDPGNNKKRSEHPD